MTIYYLICFLLLFSKFNIYAGQDNIITFIPSTPLCIGKEVQMICFVVSNTSENFIDFTALISFDGSVPATPNTINMNGVVGVNTTRYTADIVRLNISTDRPGVRLTISDYQATDGDIVFGCHGAYSGFVPSAVLVSDSPQRLADPLVLAPVTLTVSSNISLNCSIYATVQHDVTSLQRPDTILYNLTLHIDGNIVETLSPLRADQIISTRFNPTFTIDNYYHISVTAENCAGGSGSVDSKAFVLLGVYGKDRFTDISDSTGLQAQWIYSNLMEPQNGFEEDYLSKEYFTFYINNTLTQEISNISNFSLNLPYSFSFYLPPDYDRTNKNNMLVILFKGQTLADNIPILFKEIRDDTVTIILIVLSVFLLILLVAIVTIIIAFLGMYFYRKRTSNE